MSVNVVGATKKFGRKKEHHHGSFVFLQSHKQRTKQDQKATNNPFQQSNRSEWERKKLSPFLLFLSLSLSFSKKKTANERTKMGQMHVMKAILIVFSCQEEPLGLQMISQRKRLA